MRIIFYYVSVSYCNLKHTLKRVSENMKGIILTIVTIHLIHLISSNIFTDPIKLTRLFEFQMRLSRMLDTISDEELLKIPQDTLIKLFR